MISFYILAADPQQLLVWKLLFFTFSFEAYFLSVGIELFVGLISFSFLKMSFDCLLTSVDSFEKLALSIIVGPFKTRVNKLWPVHLCMLAESLSSIWLYVNIWTGAWQASLSVEFSRWEYRSGEKKKRENTGVGCHFLLQEIFPTQGSNPCLLGLLQWQVDSLPLCHLEILICIKFY